MPTFLANPLGLLGLLAIPAILIIHMLREKSRLLEISTLFLIEPNAPRTPRGRAIHFIQNSLPLWLQLFAALLCTWLLVDPRWVRANSFQSISIILDSTASMSVCRDIVHNDLPTTIRELARRAGRTEWTVVESNAPGHALYHGGETNDAIAALNQWNPLAPYHDPAPAFATALAQARGEGAIFFVTDEQPESMPAGITMLAFGKPIENCGFAGVRTWTDAGGSHWEAIVKNSGATAQQRDWWFEAGALKTRLQRLVLQPGQLETLSGPFPSGEKHLRVQLSGDAFSLDDELPLVAPEAKELSVSLAVAQPETKKLFEKVLKTLPRITSAQDAAKADVAITPADQVGFLPPTQAAILLGSAGAAQGKSSAMIAETGGLMEGLVWDGLLSKGPAGLISGNGDQVLLWQGDAPLILLHAPTSPLRLTFNFDLASSNADRLPAFVLLIDRFLSSIRDAKRGHAADNFETTQTLPLQSAEALDLVIGEHREKLSRGNAVAPQKPGFFSIRAGEEELLDAAAHFGDPREADFKKAISTGLDSTRSAAIRQVNSVPDPLAGLWLLLVAAALLGSWAAHARDLRNAFATA